MSKKTIKLPNGEAVREFYSSLKIIEEYYWEKGYRKKAYLYRTLKEKLGWEMSLESFKYHFKRTVESNGSPQKIEKISATKNEILTPNKENEPTIVRVDVNKEKNWNPHTVEIDPNRMI